MKDAVTGEEPLKVRHARPRRLRVAEEVAAILTEQILNGSRSPGARLPEAKTAESLGVSRNTLREATRILASEGLVKLEPDRGARVTLLQREDVYEIFCVRRALELRAIEESLGAPPERLADLRQALEMIVNAAEGGSWFEKASADEQFHKRLLALMGSRMLDTMYGQITSQARLLMLFVYQVQPESVFEDELSWVDGHRELYDLIAEGRAIEAKARLEKQLRQDEVHALSLVEEHEEGQGWLPEGDFDG